MARIALRVYTDPGQAEAFCSILREDGTYERITALVDTGAAISLFPLDLLNLVAHDAEMRQGVTIEQAGIARQTFSAIEATITIVLEDMDGNKSETLQVPVWFAETGRALLGFAGILDQATLHVDMPNLSGYIELDK